MRKPSKLLLPPETPNLTLNRSLNATSWWPSFSRKSGLFFPRILPAPLFACSSTGGTNCCHHWPSLPSLSFWRPIYCCCCFSAALNWSNLLASFSLHLEKALHSVVSVYWVNFETKALIKQTCWHFTQRRLKSGCPSPPGLTADWCSTGTDWRAAICTDHGWRCMTTNRRATTTTTTLWSASSRQPLRGSTCKRGTLIAIVQ